MINIIKYNADYQYNYEQFSTLLQTVSYSYGVLNSSTYFDFTASVFGRCVSK